MGHKKYFLILFLIVSTVLIETTTVIASEISSQSIESRPYPATAAVSVQPAMGYAWGTFAVTTVLVILLIGGFGLLVKKINKRSSLASPWLKVLDYQQLGPGHYLYLVELVGRFQILGVTNQTMVKIAELEDPELAVEILQDLAWRSEQVVAPWLSKIVDHIKGSKFASELKQYGKGEDL